MPVSDALTTLILAHIPDLHLEHLDLKANRLHATVTSQQPRSACPCCGKPSSSSHSHYGRSVRDLPASGARVAWSLRVRRFRCRNPNCSQRVFCERFAFGLIPRARRSARLTQTLERLSLVVGASDGARIAECVRVRTSPSTMLRIAHRSQPPPAPEPKVIGVDDFALRRGKAYGTIIVDHERGRVIDLLPDRTTQTLQTWLNARPSIQVITRDRSHEYAHACTAGAPQAVQVLDRWHVLKNLREALENLLQRYPQEIVAVARQENDTSNLPPHRRYGKDQINALTALEARRTRIERARALHAEYGSIVRVAAELPASRTFVRRAIRSQGLPDLRRNARHKSLLEPWVTELETRFKAGMRNAKQFWRELQGLGFGGSYKRVHAWVQFRREQPEERSSQTLAPADGTISDASRINDENNPQRSVHRKARSFAPGQLVWLLLSDELTDEDQVVLERLNLACPAVSKARSLALEFRRLFRDRDAPALSAWFTAVKTSGVPDLDSFAQALARERAWLEAAVSGVWSNGRVEGMVNCLKLIKRQGYGRASFELLRKRVLYG